MNGAEFQSLAAMYRHHADGIHVGGFGCHGTVDGIFVESFDSAHAIQEPPSARIAQRDLLTAYLQQVVNGADIVAKVGPFCIRHTLGCQSGDYS